MFLFLSSIADDRPLMISAARKGDINFGRPHGYFGHFEWDFVEKRVLISVHATRTLYRFYCKKVHPCAIRLCHFERASKLPHGQHC